MNDNKASIREKINSIIEKRREKLPQVQYKIRQLKMLDLKITELGRQMSDFGNQSEDFAHEIYGHSLNCKALRGFIENSIFSLRAVEKRFERTTINIGVAGKAGTGKSTLIQTLSGLKDCHIPTGEGLSVTAVRSRITHCQSRKRAVINFYSKIEFCVEVLKPYFVAAGLESIMPDSIEEFASLRLPSEEDYKAQKNNSVHQEPYFKRIIKIQKSLPQFVEFLTGAEKEYDLTEIKPFVSYPTDAEEATNKCDRRHLAVKDVLIEHPFPFTQIENVAFLDLPGLGPAIPPETLRYDETYKTEVDLVLLVTRPVGVRHEFDKWETETLHLLEKATRKNDNTRIISRGDFTLIVLNRGGADEKAVNTLKNSIESEVSEYPVLVSDVKKPELLDSEVTTPVLEHLKRALDKMDNAYWSESTASVENFVERCEKLIEELKASLGKYSPQYRSGNKIVQDAEKLSGKISVELKNLIDEYKNSADSESDEAFEAEVEKTAEEVEQWIKIGFGKKNPDSWKENAYESMASKRSAAPFIVDEFNRIRVYISQAYISLNAYLDGRVEKLWADISDAIKKHTSGLIDCNFSSGKAFLQELQSKCSYANFQEEDEGLLEPCEAFRKAISDLLMLKIEYRTHFHPKVRKALETMYCDVIDQKTGEPTNKIAVEVSQDGADLLFEKMVDNAEKVNYETKNALLREIPFPGWVLFAALEQFDDAFIRSGGSANDFRTMADSYKHLIWPEEYKKVKAYSEVIGKLRKNIETIRSELKEFKKVIGGDRND